MHFLAFQTSHHRVSNWVTDVQNQQFPIYQPTMPPVTTDAENMYQRSGASGMSLQSQQHLSSAVSLNQSQRASQQRSSGARYPKADQSSKLNQSVPVQQSGGNQPKAGYVIIYTFPSAKTGGTDMPYLIKVDDLSYPRRLTLKDVKDRCPKRGEPYRYFFKNIYEGIEVFEEVHEDTAAVPMLGGMKIFVECRGADC